MPTLNRPNWQNIITAVPYLSRSKTRPQPTCRARSSWRPRLELLEDRLTPADALTLIGDGSAVTLDLAALTATGGGFGTVSLTGVETLNLFAGVGDVTVNGTTNDDSVTVTPTGTDTATLTAAGINLTVNTDNTGTLGVDTRSGSDTLTVNGSPAANDILVNAATVTVTGNRSVTFTPATLEALSVATLAGNDTITVDVSSFDVVSVSLTVDGGDDTDLMTVQGTPATAVDEVIYAPGPAVSDGQLTYESQANVVLMQINFTNLEPVIDIVPSATATVGATDGDNTITYSVGPNSGTAVLGGAASGLVSVDSFETYEFANKSSLTINAKDGSDTINLNNPTTPTGLTGITVNGGDPTGNDALIVNGTVAADTMGVTLISSDSISVTGAGPVPILGNTIEDLNVNGQGGNDTLSVTTPTGIDHVTFTPGGAVDAADVTVTPDGGGSLVPLTFLQIGTAGSVTFLDAGGGRADTLDVTGTAAGDVFNVGIDTIQVLQPAGAPTTVALHTPAIATPTLHGLDGADTFNLVAPLTYIRTVVDGGNPSDSDTLNLTGDPGEGDDIILDLAALTVAGSGLGTVSPMGVEMLNVNAANGDVIVLGTANADDVTVTPTGADTTTLTAAGINLVVSTSNTGTLSIDARTGNDTLTVNGTAGDDTLDVNGPGNMVLVAGLQPIDFLGVESLRVPGRAGSDTFDVTPTNDYLIFIDGGDPTGAPTLATRGDRLNVTTAMTRTITGPGAGTLSGSGVQSISYVNIELPVDLSVTLQGPRGPVLRGDTIAGILTVHNPGSGNAFNVTLTSTTPAGATFVSLTAPPEFLLTTPEVGASGAVIGNAAVLPPGTFVLTLVVRVDSGMQSPLVDNTVTLTSSDDDPLSSPANNGAFFETVVTLPALPLTGHEDTGESFILTRFTLPTRASGPPYTAAINWGDGTTSTGTVRQESTGAYVVSARHTYTDESPHYPDAALPYSFMVTGGPYRFDFNGTVLALDRPFAGNDPGTAEQRWLAEVQDNLLNPDRRSMNQDDATRLAFANTWRDLYTRYLTRTGNPNLARRHVMRDILTQSIVAGIVTQILGYLPRRLSVQDAEKLLDVFYERYLEHGERSASWHLALMRLLQRNRRREVIEAVRETLANHMASEEFFNKTIR